MHHIPTISPHAAERIASRFGVEGEAAQQLWALRVMGEARTISTQLRPYQPARLVWQTDTIRLITEGNEVVTAYPVTPLQAACLLYELAQEDEEGQAAHEEPRTLPLAG